MRRTVLVGVGLLVAAVVAWQLRGRDRASPELSPYAGGGSGWHHRGLPADGSTTIAGHVTRADGTPLANAVVVVAHTDVARSRADMPTIAVVTDRDGAWITPVLPGAYTVAATAVGFLPQHEPIMVVVNTHVALDLALAPGGVLVRGTITDIGGGPIANVQLVTRDDDVEVAALTRADGTYQLTVPAGGHRVIARHDDYDDVTSYVELVDVPVVRDLKMVPTATISGVVIARDTNKPVPDALVGTDHWIEVVADGDGSFTLHALGEVELFATARGYASANPTIVQAGVGERVGPVKVVVDRAFAIRGRVVREGTKEPIAGVRVDGSARSRSTTDANGTFELVGLRPGLYMVTLSKDGFVSSSSEAIEVVDHDVSDVALELSPGVTISGRVDPPATATIRVLADDDRSILSTYLHSIHVTTEPRGSFVVHAVPSGSLKLAATAVNGDDGSLPIVVGTENLSNLVVKLESRASISGKVVDTSGAPMAGIEVSADAAHSDGTDVTHGDGTFKIVGLRRESYSVSISIRDREWVEDTATVDVDLTNGRDRSNIVLTAKRSTGTIRGRVVANGKPQSDVWVRAIDPETYDDLGKLLTDVTGSFTFEHARRGSYEITANTVRQDASARVHDVKAGTPVTITLVTLQTAAVHVTAAGSPVSSFHYVCVGVGGDRVNTLDGTWTLKPMSPGDHECMFDGIAGTATVHVSVPGESVLEVALLPRTILTGSVVDVQGAPVTGYEITMTAGHYSESDDSMPTSHFEFTRVPAGHVVIDIRYKGHHAAREVTATGATIDLGVIKLDE